MNEKQKKEQQEVVAKLVNVFNDLREQFKDSCPTFSVAYSSKEGAYGFNYPVESTIKPKEKKQWKKNLKELLPLLIRSYRIIENNMIPNRVEAFKHYKTHRNYVKDLQKEVDKTTCKKKNQQYKRK